MSTVIESAYTRPKLLQVSLTSSQLLHTKVSFSLHRRLHKGTETSLSTTGPRALQSPPRPSHLPQSETPPAAGRNFTHSAPLMSAEGGHSMEVKLSFRREHSCLSVRLCTQATSLLLISAVPRQLLLVEVDDHLGTPGAGFAGRQQGHIV